jgi:hypothetical protein
VETNMNWKKFTLTVCALALMAGTTRSGLAQKETPPEGGTPKPFKLPPKQSFALPNGLGATLVPYGTLPKVTVSVVVRTGNLNEPADKIWPEI